MTAAASWHLRSKPLWEAFSLYDVAAFGLGSAWCFLLLASLAFTLLYTAPEFPARNDDGKGQDSLS